MNFFHSSHPNHELKLKNYQKPYTCDGCKERGFGSRYRCETCDFDLHQDCMFPQSSSSHEFFENSTFEFFQKPPRTCRDSCKRNCDACGKAINGFVYHCEEDDWDLHPCCRNLKRKYFIDDVVLVLEKEVRSKCIWCNKKNITSRGRGGVKGWSYISKCEKYHLHVSCVNEMILEEWKNGNGGEIGVGGETLAMEKVDLKEIQRRGNRNGGRGNKYLRIVKLLFKTIACILLGDPTITIACLLVDLLA